MSTNYPRYIQTTTTSTNFTVLDVRRNTNHTGGTPGFVNSAARIYTNVATDVTNFEWALTSVLDNYSLAGENVAIYGQANKRAYGTTWAGVFEAKDWNASSVGGTAGLVGIEVDVFANGTDTNNNRIGIDIVAGRTNPADTTCRVTWGIRLAAQGNNPANATYAGGIQLNATMVTGIQLAGDMTRGIYFTDTKAVGVDFSAATYSACAVRFNYDTVIQLEPSGNLKIETPSAGDFRLKLINGATEYVGFKINATNPGLYVNTIKVVGAQQSAIADGADAKVNAILAALRAHGLIAT